MYTLHYTVDAASLVIRVALLELDQPFDTVLLDRSAGGADTPAYRTLHPLGLVPVLETPDGPLFETVAILLLLADRHGAMAPGPDSPDRAAFLTWLMFTNTSIHTTLMQLFYPDRVAGADAVPAVITAARARMTQYLGLLDAAIAVRPAWADPEMPTVLGHYIGLLMRWLQYGDAATPTRFALADYPAIRSLLAALEQRPAVQLAARAERLGPRLYTDPNAGA